MTARAVWFTAPRTVELRRAEVGPPGPGQVLVESERSGISAGTELLAYRGQIPRDLRPDLPTVEGDFQFPLKFGYACVGRAVQRGPGTEAPALGQRVFAWHPHQSRFLVDQAFLAPLPEALPAECGLFFANLETAFNVLLDAHPRLDERVVIFGQGIVGLLVTWLLRRAGAGSIVAVDPFPRRRAAAEQLGADLTLAPEEATAERLTELSGGRGLDLAIEASGSPAALQAAIDTVAFQGTVLACAWYGAKSVTLELGSRFHRGRVRLVSSQVSSLDPALSPRWDRVRRAESVTNLLPLLPWEALVSHRFPLARAQQAYQLLDEAPGETLQVVFTYGDD